MTLPPDRRISNDGELRDPRRRFGHVSATAWEGRKADGLRHQAGGERQQDVADAFEQAGINVGQLTFFAVVEFASKEAGVFAHNKFFSGWSGTSEGSHSRVGS